MMIPAPASLDIPNPKILEGSALPLVVYALHCHVHEKISGEAHQRLHGRQTPIFLPVPRHTVGSNAQDVRRQHFQKPGRRIGHVDMIEQYARTRPLCGYKTLQSSSRLRQQVGYSVHQNNFCSRHAHIRGHHIRPRIATRPHQIGGGLPDDMPPRTLVGGIGPQRATGPRATLAVSIFRSDKPGRGGLDGDDATGSQIHQGTEINSPFHTGSAGPGMRPYGLRLKRRGRKNGSSHALDTHPFFARTPYQFMGQKNLNNSLCCRAPLVFFPGQAAQRPRFVLFCGQTRRPKTASRLQPTIPVNCASRCSDAVTSR